jgi:hypothetical protein
MGSPKPGFCVNIYRKKVTIFVRNRVFCVISNPVASELYGRGGFIGFVNTEQISRRTRPYKNYDDTIPNQTEMI